MRTILRRALLALSAGLFVPPAASAADATADGAAQIKEGLGRYVGPGALTVTPEGTAYKVDFDIKAMLRGLERFGVTLEPATYTATIAPDGDGVWHVTSGGLPALSVKYGNQITSVVTNGQSFDGSFDTHIPAFTRWTSHYDSISVGVTGNGPATQARQLTQGQQTFSATATGDGTIDGTLSQSNASYAQDVTIDDPKTHLDVAVKGGKTSESATTKGLHVRAATDLWAFLVAHPSTDAIKASQADLRSLLRQLLPLFQSWSQDGTLDALAVKTPVGTFGAQHLATHLDLHGLTADGLVGLSVKADGLTIPTDKLPRWSSALVPTAVALRTAFSGFKLDEAAETVVDTFDLTASKPVPQATMDKLPALLGPRDRMLVTIGDSRITSPTVDMHFSGDVRLTEPLPTVAVAVHATGLDQAIATMQQAAKQDASAAQAIAMLILAKGYGKAEPDGGLGWAIAVDSLGVATINGVPLPTGKQK